MTVKISKKPKTGALKPIVEKMSGVDLSLCYQCKKCSSGCPSAKFSQSPPAEIVRRLLLGAGDELLSNDHIWLCLSCEMCYSRCPMRLNIAAVIDALRALAIERKAAVPAGNVPAFNKAFLNTVKYYGRSYDLAAIVRYKLGGNKLTQDIEKLPAMLKKGKIAVMPPAGAAKKTVKRIFSKTGEKGRGQ